MLARRAKHASPHLSKAPRCVLHVIWSSLTPRSRSRASVTSAKNPFITRGPAGASCLLRFLEDAFFSGGGAGAFGVSTRSTSNTTKGSSCDAERATCVRTVSFWASRDFRSRGFVVSRGDGVLVECSRTAPSRSRRPASHRPPTARSATGEPPMRRTKDTETNGRRRLEVALRVQFRDATRLRIY